MNAIEETEFSKKLSTLGKTLPRPKAILCISAHWETSGTYVTSMPWPKTIHDFHGFPQALFDVEYAAPGDLELALRVKKLIDKPVELDEKSWGLDHGAWSVLKHLYPKADVPVVQLSLDMTKPAKYHFELGKKLHQLRSEEVLIVGSGNIVHNLRTLIWDKNAKPHEWATQFDEEVKKHLIQKDYAPLMDELLQIPAGKLSVPTMDHYYPLLYVLGASDKNDVVKFEFEEIQLGSISMRTFLLD